ncbi:MAG: hypothetical protein JW829_13445 [Pirellulales bacterium]|nr:hypothetical protein [Pirellulales bacterium]
MFDENPYNGSPRGFYRFDLNTHELSLITEVDKLSDRFTGFAWHPIEQRIYAGSEQGRLYTIDLFTGNASLVGQVPVTGSHPFIRGIAIQPQTHQIYGMGFGPRLYKIDGQTADAVEVGMIEDLDGGLAFTPDGTLYGWAPVGRLMEIDLETLETMIFSGTSIGIVSNLTSSPDGTLFGSAWQRGGITMINRHTGAGTRIAEYGDHTNGVIGVFYYIIPEPSSIGLLISLVLLVLGIGRAKAAK